MGLNLPTSILISFSPTPVNSILQLRKRVQPRVTHLIRGKIRIRTWLPDSTWLGRCYFSPWVLEEWKNLDFFLFVTISWKLALLFLLFFWLVVLGFNFRALSLALLLEPYLGLFTLAILQIGSPTFSWDWNLPAYGSLSNWDYRCKTSHPACSLR
jgi:hypothetical protein